MLKKVLYVVALPVILVVAWWFGSSSSTSIYFPPLQTIVDMFAGVWFEGGADSRLVREGVPSVYRLLAGFVLATAIAVPVGVVIGSSAKIRAFCEPTLEFFRAIPGPVLVPVIGLFAGIGDAMKIIVIITGCLWPILLNTVEGVRAVDPVMSETARSYRIRPATQVRTLILPAASPQIVAGMRQGLSVGIILMVISEMFSSTDGLGFTVVQFQRLFAIPEMWTGIIVLGVLGVILAQLFKVFENWILKW